MRRHDGPRRKGPCDDRDTRFPVLPPRATHRHRARGGPHAEPWWRLHGGRPGAAHPRLLATQLSARITSWQGAAGSRIADVRLYNTSFLPCYVRNFPRVRLVSAGGAILIGGPAASATGAKHTITPLHYRHTMVKTSNYCHGAYVLSLIHI